MNKIIKSLIAFLMVISVFIYIPSDVEADTTTIYLSSISTDENSPTTIKVGSIIKKDDKRMSYNSISVCRNADYCIVLNEYVPLTEDGITIQNTYDGKSENSETISTNTGEWEGICYGDKNYVGLKIWPATKYSTTTTLSSNSFSVNYGQTWTLTAQTKQGNTNISGAVVSYYSDATCINKLSATPTDAGTYYARGEYSGNSSYKASNSDVITITINDTRSTPIKVELTGSFESTYGSLPNINAYVYLTDSNTGTPINDGVVYYSDGACTSKVADITSAGVGTYYIRGEYPGDNSYKPLNSEVKTLTINKADRTYSFSVSSLEKHISDKDTTFTNAISPSPTTSVRYSSSDTDVASIDVSSGLITIKDVGSTTISAVISGGTNYNDSTITYTLTVSDHTYGDPTYTWSNDYSAVTASRSCIKCSKKDEQQVSTTSEVIREADCTNPEITKYTATFTNNAFTTQTKEIETNAALGHTIVKHEAKAATETSDGNIEYYTCSVCNKYFLDEDGQTETTKDKVTIKALGKKNDSSNSGHVLTCEEYMKDKNWTWSKEKNTCVYKVRNTSVK